MHQRIKTIRSTLELTQLEFGKRLGVSRDVISNIEGNRATPRLPFLEHLCDCFQVNHDWLMTGKGAMFLTSKAQLSQKQLQEAISVFATLNPDYQTYALRQIRELYKLQEEQKK